MDATGCHPESGPHHTVAPAPHSDARPPAGHPLARKARLRAVLDELRAVAPAARSTRWLAERFAVSMRTIERDARALAAAGAPIYPVPEPEGGYAVDSAHTLPPLTLTAAEAVTVAAGLARLSDTALGGDAERLLGRVHARFPGLPAATAGTLAGIDDTGLPSVPAVLSEALRAERVLHLDYADRHGQVSHRSVEPIGFVGTREGHLLLAWCRLRHGVRAFRLDRVRAARLGRAPVTARRDLARVDRPAPAAPAHPVPRQRPAS